MYPPGYGHYPPPMHPGYHYGPPPPYFPPPRPIFVPRYYGGPQYIPVPIPYGGGGGYYPPQGPAPAVAGHPKKNAWYYVGLGVAALGVVFAGASLAITHGAHGAPPAIWGGGLMVLGGGAVAFANRKPH